MRRGYQEAEKEETGSIRVTKMCIMARKESFEATAGCSRPSTSANYISLRAGKNEGRRNWSLVGKFEIESERKTVCESRTVFCAGKDMKCFKKREQEKTEEDWRAEERDRSSRGLESTERERVLHEVQ